MKIFTIWTMLTIFFISISYANPKNIEKTNDLMIRISEIKVYQNYLDEYISILKEEAKASVKLESGVIAIYPMFQKDNPTKIRILEIYANEEAYKQHLKTPPFIYYKTETLKMVESLKLIDMNEIDKESMFLIFKKEKK